MNALLNHSIRSILLRSPRPRTLPPVDPTILSVLLPWVCESLGRRLLASQSVDPTYSFVQALQHSNRLWALSWEHARSLIFSLITHGGKDFSIFSSASARR